MMWDLLFLVSRRRLFGQQLKVESILGLLLAEWQHVSRFAELPIAGQAGRRDRNLTWCMTGGNG